MIYEGLRTQLLAQQHLVASRPLSNPSYLQWASADNNAACAAFRLLV